MGWLAPKIYKTICRYAEQQEFLTLYLSLYPITKESKVNEYRFESNPFRTQKDRANVSNRGGSGIIILTATEKGTWIGESDIVRGKNGDE